MKQLDESREYYDITVTQLRDLEQRVLNYMILSASNFKEIATLMQEDDFVFTVHKRIYVQLIRYKDYFLKGCDFFIASLTLKIDDSTYLSLFFDGLRRSSVKEILSQQASMDIKNDIGILKMLYEQRVQILEKKDKSPVVTVLIEDKNSYTTIYFIEGIAIEIETRGLMNISDKLLFLYSELLLDYLSSINFETEGIVATIDIDEETDAIVSMHLKKDIAELQWIDNLCSWADQHNLDEKIFPRTRAGLEELKSLRLSNLSIDALPNDISKLQNLESLYLCDNNLKTIPKWISKLQNLKVLHISNNKLTDLPYELFNLKYLVDLCLHKNQLTILPEEIGKLTNLTQLSISNNNISKLPQNIIKLKRILSFQIENTLIEHMPAKFLENKRIKILCINDEILAEIAKELIATDIDTINLTASNYNEFSEIVQALNLHIDDTQWMAEEDKMDRGCVLLKKDPIQSAVRIANSSERAL